MDNDTIADEIFLWVKQFCVSDPFIAFSPAISQRELSLFDCMGHFAKVSVIINDHNSKPRLTIYKQNTNNSNFKALMSIDINEFSDDIKDKVRIKVYEALAI